MAGPGSGSDSGAGSIGCGSGSDCGSGFGIEFGCGVDTFEMLADSSMSQLRTGFEST